jgi:energy-coupling factor transporter transmembrane protein EcfT
MKNSRTGLLIFILIVVLAFVLGSYMLMASFFGVITLIGLIALVESIKPLKWLLSRSTKVFDVIIFVCSILATMNYGLNIAASLTVAGLGYTLYYGPKLREELRGHKPKKKREPVGNYKSNFDWK